ncbi:MAG: LacI family DNA-binding transcriptional regulator [Pseudomonadota bacterium]
MKPTAPFKRARASIKDVATRAGCGIATVSRVLNASGPTSVATRDRVLAAADELGFQRSDIGRSLRTQRTRTIGCVVPSIANPVFAQALQGLQRAARSAGHQLIVSASNYALDQELEAVTTLLGKQVDAVVLTVSDPASSQALDLVRERELPHALMFNHAPGLAPCASIDNASAASLVADAFVEHGHRQLGFLALRFGSSDRSRQRFEGFGARLHAHGFPPPVLLEVDDDPALLADHLPSLLKAHRHLTGIFASNDMLALAVMQATRTLGLRVPDDLSIVGFDGIAIGQMVEPTLATVQTDPEAMGVAAAETVLAALREDDQSSSCDQTRFHFRPGGSLSRCRGDQADSGEVAASPLPSPTHPREPSLKKD